MQIWAIHMLNNDNKLHCSDNQLPKAKLNGIVSVKLNRFILNNIILGNNFKLHFRDTWLPTLSTPASPSRMSGSISFRVITGK